MTREMPVANLDFQIPPDLAVNSRRRRQRSSDSLLKAIIGIIVVAACLYAIRIAYVHFMIDRFNQQIQHSTQQIQASLQAQAERTRQHQLAIEHERTLHTQMELDAQREQRERQLAAQQEAQRMEAAWDKFYTPAEMCQNPLTQAAIVECGNRHIRERRKFVAMWAKDQNRLFSK